MEKKRAHKTIGMKISESSSQNARFPTFWNADDAHCCGKCAMILQKLQLHTDKVL